MDSAGKSKQIMACILAFLIVWNQSKVPYFLGALTPAPMTNVTYDASACVSDPPPYQCLGAEVSINLGAWFGYRASKLISDQFLFLAVHAVAGSILLLVMILVLLGYASVFAASPFFLVGTILFVLHVWPERAGVPHKLFNTAVIIADLLAAALGLIAMRMMEGSWPYTKERPVGKQLLLASWLVIGVTMIGAGGIEFLVLALSLMVRYMTGEWWLDAGDTPAAASGHGFYSAYSSLGAAYSLIALLLVTAFFGLSHMKTVGVVESDSDQSSLVQSSASESE